MAQDGGKVVSLTHRPLFMYIRVFLSDFNETRIISKEFRKIVKY